MVSIVCIALNISGAVMNGDKYLKFIQSADIVSLSQDFNNSVQLTTPGKEGVYSKSQAKIIISNFFDNHTPKTVTIKSQGQSDNGAQFVILNNSTNRGVFKVSIFYRVNGSTSRIHEMKIQK